MDINDIEIIIASGEPSTRKKLYNNIKDMGLNIASLIDPTALVSNSSTIGEGVIIAPFSNITSSTVLGHNVAINAIQL